MKQHNHLTTQHGASAAAPVPAIGKSRTVQARMEFAATALEQENIGDEDGIIAAFVIAISQSRWRRARMEFAVTGRGSRHVA